MPKPDTNFQKTISAAYTLLGSVLVLSGIGYYLANQYNNILWFIICAILGIIVGMYEPVSYTHLRAHET